LFLIFLFLIFDPHKRPHNPHIESYTTPVLSVTVVLSIYGEIKCDSLFMMRYPVEKYVLLMTDFTTLKKS